MPIQNLVVDACVARSAGGSEASHPVSRASRDFLHEMMRNKFYIVRTPEIWSEWKNHKSRYATLWLSSMTAKRRILNIQTQPDAALRSHARSQVCEKTSNALMKDCHLVEAAKATDNTIISNEELARGLSPKQALQ